MSVAVETRVNRTVRVCRVSRKWPVKGIESTPPRGRRMSKVLFRVVAEEGVRRWVYCWRRVEMK